MKELERKGGKEERKQGREKVSKEGRGGEREETDTSDVLGLDNF